MATSESGLEAAPPSAAEEADAGEADAPSSEAESPASASAPPSAPPSAPASAPESAPESPQEPISPKTAHATEVALAEVSLSEVTVSGRQSSSFESMKSRTISRPEGYVPVGKKHKVRVIRGPTEITPEWLTKVFTARKYLKPGGFVKAVRHKPLGGGLGVMGEIGIVEVDLEGASSRAPTTFVAKFCPQNSFGLPRPIKETLERNVFGVEAHWYNDFLEEDLALPRPEAYFIGAKLAHRKPWRRSPVFCMLIELMPPALYSRVSGCDNLRHCMLLMETLARFHANWWDAEKAPPIEFITHPAKDMGGIAVQVLAVTATLGIPALRRCFGEPYAKVLEWAPMLSRRVHQRLARMMFKAPLTLAHGDVHLDNIFFNESFAQGLKLIDFGNIMILQGCFDVASFIGTCLDPPFRRAHEADLIGHYHATLTDALPAEKAAAFPLERCWRDYRVNLWRMLINITYVTYTQFDKERKAGKGIFAKEPTKEDAKLKATYAAVNSRLAEALVDNKFDEIISECRDKGRGWFSRRAR